MILSKQFNPNDSLKTLQSKWFPQNTSIQMIIPNTLIQMIHSKLFYSNDSILLVLLNPTLKGRVEMIIPN